MVGNINFYSLLISSFSLTIPKLILKEEFSLQPSNIYYLPRLYVENAVYGPNYRFKKKRNPNLQ